MNFEDVVINRHSCRGFLQKEVSTDLLKKLVSLASHSVSSANIQPWEFHIITGDSLEKLKEANTDAFTRGLDIKNFVTIPKDTPYKERQRAIGSALFEAMSIKRDDAEKRNDWYMKGYRYFDAPALLLITMDKILSRDYLLDIGCAIQTFCHAAYYLGLGTCVQNQAVNYEDAIREILGIPLNKYLVAGVAVGYADENAPANKVQAIRARLEDICEWYE